ncbi:hypothetical protein ABB37_02728 [Leptomonas pyrrhocoris]|uniref:Uncharacterized protein n=1 Tax=Leptomonas pyrrhocoris TaxID=157538 RepID=A0A0N0DXI3_LEPPY|nr:hypothetical protein ABB37_02728 [Leptomonas pyrrhocoris]XP_015661431.1 hypothetical protein ABB37_02728 [Leptomonas pyrrhocoris]KPA82991.1 hypothetical protein ABB37_02728 [Leptomonas pyrrhocoris]KPA82992.1 hypothetical protein ABB37_02728 [Leptomonas pyrrhocoris]|eukprot:XP_015661430.1 hypothetical protein ABB37_02728 [Leptomonas pyrrhocoris]
MSYDPTRAYHSSYHHRTPTAYQEPIAHRQGYTEPRLTTAEHGAVIAACSVTCALATVPIAKLEHFYFMCDVPGESSRIYMSDKRAQFFRVLFHTRWWQGRSVPWLTVDYAFSLGLFVALRQQLEAAAPAWSNRRRGFLAGAAAGAIYAALRHPFDVLRTTAEATTGLRQFRGAGDVFFTALKERPTVLKGLYRGFTVALTGRTAQFALQFGLYNWLRYDGVYRSPVMLFLYCHAATFLGLLAQYPVQALRQQLYLANTSTRGRPQSYRSLIMDIRRRHGITKVYDGFFKHKPFLNAVPPALLMCIYDVSTRRCTEYLYPERIAKPVHEQSLTSVAAPPRVRAPPAYEFERKD